MPPRTDFLVTSIRRSSWRRNASSNTVGSTADGKSSLVAALTGCNSGRYSCAESSARLVDRRRRHRVEHRANDRVAGDPFGLSLEIADHAVAQRGQRDCPDVVDRNVESALE